MIILCVEKYNFPRGAESLTIAILANKRCWHQLLTHLDPFECSSHQEHMDSPAPWSIGSSIHKTPINITSTFAQQFTSKTTFLDSVIIWNVSVSKQELSLKFWSWQLLSLTHHSLCTCWFTLWHLYFPKPSVFPIPSTVLYSLLCLPSTLLSHCLSNSTTWSDDLSWLTQLSTSSVSVLVCIKLY